MRRWRPRPVPLRRRRESDRSPLTVEARGAAPQILTGGLWLLEHRVLGTTMPVLEIDLGINEAIVSEAGELSWMTSSIELRTSTQGGGAKGLFGALKRAVAGGGLFLTEYTSARAPGTVAFAAKMPGQIVPITVGPGAGYMVHRHGFLCAGKGIEIALGFQRSLGAGIFGGEGFVLQRLTGAAPAWIELSGEVVEKELGMGETLRVHPGHVGMFEEQVHFDIVTLPGIRNVIFGGDGLFLAALTGPGKVWLQSLPLPNLAHSLRPYLAVGQTAEAAGAGGAAGAIIGGLLGGR